MKLKPRTTPALQPNAHKDPALGQLPPGFAKTTLAALGANLPIGVAGAGGKLLKPFELKLWTMKEEVEVGRLKKKHAKAGGRMGPFVSDLIALFAVKIAGQEFAKLDQVQREMFVRGLYIPDVLYMYIYLRRMAKGSRLPINLECPGCGQPIGLDGDLDTLEVLVVQERASIQGDIELKSGISYHGERRRKLKVELAKWEAFERAQGLDPGSMTRAMIENCVIGIEGVEANLFTPPPASSFDDMEKVDIDELTAFMQEQTPGPQLAAELQCPNPLCPNFEKDMVAPVPWQYDAFYETSSPSAQSRKSAASSSS
jgi:hypothetical protein